MRHVMRLKLNYAQHELKKIDHKGIHIVLNCTFFLCVQIYISRAIN